MVVSIIIQILLILLVLFFVVFTGYEILESQKKYRSNSDRSLNRYAMKFMLFISFLKLFPVLSILKRDMKFWFLMIQPVIRRNS